MVVRVDWAGGLGCVVMGWGVTHEFARSSFLRAVVIRRQVAATSTKKIIEKKLKPQTKSSSSHSVAPKSVGVFPSHQLRNIVQCEQLLAEMQVFIKGTETKEGVLNAAVERCKGLRTKAEAKVDNDVFATTLVSPNILKKGGAEETRGHCRPSRAAGDGEGVARQARILSSVGVALRCARDIGAFLSVYSR